ncbi:hypothetical protein KR084_010324, partial [Drosophila pseudotakahashii]
YTAAQQFYFSLTLENYMDAAPIPLPINVDAAETTRFSCQRSRDISSTVIPTQASISHIDITTDNSFNAVLSNLNICQDLHVQSYDCFGLISLSSAMQSNVPIPFEGFNKYSHLNMPGGQWSQEYKFIAQNMHYSHYSSLRNGLRADWATYDQNATLKSNGQGFTTKRKYGTQSQPPNSTTTISSPSNSMPTDTSAKLSKKVKLKQAFKDYGVSIVAFHIGISLISLGGFYVLVSSGINLVPVLEFLGIGSTAIADKVATGSTFVVAYAVHKVFAPARISITLGAAPFIVRYLRSKGFQMSKTKNP